MRARSTALVTAVLVAGAMSMGLEMLGSRLLAPDFGQSLYTWGALIAVVLLALAAGYAAGAFASRRWAGLRPVGALLLVGGAWVAVLPGIAGPVTEHVSSWGERAGALCASSALFALPIAAFAAVGPICIRLQVRDPRDAGLWAGLLSAVGTVGSVVGTLGTSFFLIEHWSVRGSLLVGGLATAAVGVALPLLERKGERSPGAPLPAHPPACAEDGGGRGGSSSLAGRAAAELVGRPARMGPSTTLRCRGSRRPRAPELPHGGLLAVARGGSPSLMKVTSCRRENGREDRGDGSVREVQEGNRGAQGRERRAARGKG